MTFASELAALNPRVWWRLGEASGTAAADASGNSEPGTYVNTPTLGVTGLVGDANTAVSFAAASTEHVVSDNTFGPETLPEWSLVAAVRPTATAIPPSALGHIVGFDIPGSLYLTLETNATTPQFWAYAQGASSSWSAGGDGAEIEADTDYLVVAVFDGTNLRIYVNGALYSTATETSDDQLIPSAQLFTVGDDSDGAGFSSFDGVIDETAFFDTALTGAAVLSLAIAAGLAADPFALPLLDDSSAPTTFPLTRAVSTIPQATPAGQGTQWNILAVDRFGVVYAEYPSARLDKIVWIKNAPEEVTFTVPIDAPDLAHLPLANEDTTPHREVQIWRNGHMLVWAVPVARQADSDNRTYTYRAKGLLWYLSRRYMGQANRHNYLNDGSFEVPGLPTWPLEGTGITKTQDTTFHVLGPNSMKLVQTTGGLDAFAHQANVIRSTHVGLALFLTVWIRVGSFVAPALQDRGVFIVRNEVAEFANFEIVATTPVGTFLRASTILHMPPDVIETIDTRIYPPRGTLYADAATLTTEQSLAMVGSNAPGGAPGWDQVAMARYVLDYAQGRGAIANEFPEGNGKSDLNFGFGGADSGVQKERVWQFMDHQRIYVGPNGNGVLDEFLKADDGFDISMVNTAVTRTFTAHYPRVGVDRTDIELRYINDPINTARNVRQVVTDWHFEENIEQSANDIVVLGGWGHGAGREEGSYHEPATLGGLTLELVESAPQETPIDALNSFAAARGAQLDHAVQTPRLVLEEPRHPTTNEVTYPLIGVILPGDRLVTYVEDGDVVLDGTYEFVRVELDGATELLIVVPNPI